MENNVIFTRRSIRRFLDKPVKQEKIERILKAGMQAHLHIICNLGNL